MKNIAPILIAVLVIGGTILGLYGFMRGLQAETTPASQPATAPVQTTQENTGPELAPPNNDSPTGRYLPFTPEALAGSANTRRVLFFYANWCPTCRPADASFSQNTSQIPPDVTLIRVNYNDPETDQAEKDLARQYEVTYQHTFVQIDGDGNVVAKWNGGEIDELLNNLK